MTDSPIRVASATALLAANGLSLLKAMDFLEKRVGEIDNVTIAMSFGVPLVGLAAAYLFLRAGRKVMASRPTLAEGVAIIAVFMELSMWAGYVGVFG